VVWSLRSCSWPAVPASVRTWWTVRLVDADSPRGASCPGVLHVHRVFLSAFISIGLVSCFWSGGVWRTVHLGVVDRPCSPSCSRTVRGPGVDRPLFKVRFWRFCCVFRTIHSRVVDRSPQSRGPSTWAFTELLSPLLLWFRFRFGIVWGLFLGLLGLL
jgi:hypothetical protein